MKKWIRQLKNYSTFVILIFVMGRGQNLERWNVERPIFRNFEIENIKRMKDELFHGFIFELIFLHFFFELAEGRNFERRNVEQPIFRNKKWVVLKVTGGPVLLFSYLRNDFLFFKIIWSLKF